MSPIEMNKNTKIGLKFLMFFEWSYQSILAY